MSADESASIPSNDNADWGRTVETVACERFGLVLVADEPGAPWWFDAHATECIGHPEAAGALGEVIPGTPVEVKAARYRIQNGSPRRGRWWLAEQSHDRLLAADGEYVLAVYDPAPERENRVLALGLRPAWWVDSLVTRWSGCGSGHHADRAAQIPWSRAFDESDVSLSNGGAST